MKYRHKIRTTTAVMESCIKAMENVLGYFENETTDAMDNYRFIPLPCGVLTRNVLRDKLKLQR